MTTETLREKFIEPEKRAALIAELLPIIEKQLASAPGWSGRGLRAAVQILDRAIPRLLSRALNSLLDPFLDALNETAERAKKEGTSMKGEVEANILSLTEELLSITDARIKKVDHVLARKTYDKLRPLAAEHVSQSLPKIAVVIEKSLKN
ncbi:MAG: hypothetical protein MK135_08495 [Polyangiaceae bacterium]|nr:hypothetical protein [Polyangiaceae bacterium]